jgi:hypothetical protein
MDNPAPKEFIEKANGFVKSYRGKARMVRQAHHDNLLACPEPVEGRDAAQRSI